MSALQMGWLGYFIVAWLLAAFNFALVKKGLLGMSPATAVAIEAAVIFLIRVMVYGPAAFFTGLISHSPKTWLWVAISAVIIAAAWIGFFYAMQTTSGIGVAPFYYIIFPVQMIITYVLSRSLPDWQMIVVLLLFIVGAFMMGFGREHKNPMWWPGAIGGPLLMGAFYAFAPKFFPAVLSDEEIQCLVLFVVFVISLIASLFMKDGDVKKVTVYHLLFIVVAGICVYLSPVLESRALKLSEFDVIITICCALWVVLYLIISKILMNEMLTNVCAAGLVMIIAASVWYYAFIAA